MKDAVVLESNDIKKILAEKFNVPESNIIKSQYSYTVVLKDEVEQLYSIPNVPSTNGTYTLKATRSASGVAYNWVSG